MRRAFTLLEMTVVLAIVALVTHLAVRQLNVVRDAKLIEAADRQFEVIRDGVFGYGPDGAPEGFLADMGRPPRLTDGTLSELWSRPPGVSAYAVLPAMPEHFAPGVDPELKQTNVVVATGWRGPYLRLPLGRRRLSDPWGNPLENPDAAGFDRLTVTQGVVTAVSHFGPTGQRHDPERRECVAILPETDGTWLSQLVLTAWSRSGQSPAFICYKWFGPHDGQITGGVAQVAFEAPHTFRGMTPGTRVIWYGTGATPAAAAAAAGASRLVNVRPGVNRLQVELP